GAVSSNYVLPLKAGTVSYYTLTPSSDQSITAGGSVSYTVTARDQFGNGVVNSDNVTLSTPGSSTATISPSASLSFGNDSTLSFSVQDTVTGSFTVRVAKTDNSNIKGESGLITVNAGALSYVIIRTEANNGGSETGDLNITTDDAVDFYAAGYDQYGNYISDVSVTWSSTGTLEPVNATGSKFTFNPEQAGGSGNIVATPSGGATADQTGTINVSVGALAEIRIQIADTQGGSSLADTAITADQTLTLYSVGYDADGNYKGVESSNWTLRNLSGTLSPANPTTSVTFTPSSTGSGSIKAEAAANAQISDQTGSITVNAGAISYVIIRDEANGGGQEIGAVSMTAGETLTLYAAGYDGKDNFAGNAAVDWSTTGTLSGLSSDNTNTYVVTLSPLSPGSGTVQTSNANGWTDDETGTITVSQAGLARIEIRTAANGGGNVLDDSTANAGESWTLYAAGYDTYDNYLSDVAVKWSTTGDSIGYFASADSASSNTFYFTRKNSGKFLIKKNNGGTTISDASGIIKVQPGAPASMQYVSSSSFTGSAGSKIADSLAIRVLDAFSNPVPGITVAWEAQDPTSSLTPSSDLTDNLGISRSKWKLRNTVGKDSAYAVVADIPDSLKFTATVLESQANALERWVDASNDSSRTGTVKTQLAQPLVLEVTDSLGNPVSNVPVTFTVLNFPEGGGDYSFSPDASETTDQTGRASVYFTPGSKAGTYNITGYNDNLLNSGNLFFSITADPDAADHIVLITESNLQDTVATVYGDSVRVKVVDVYGNTISGVTVDWLPTSTGSVNPSSSVTNSGGLAATEWTLRQNVDKDTLNIQSTGLASIQAYAQLIPDQAAVVAADSGNYRTGVAGSSQLLRARVEDRFGNVIASQKVSFQPLNSDGYLSGYEVNTDADGLAQTTYTSPDDVDSSQVRAYIANVDTTLFTVYGIRYQSQTLSPAVVELNDPVTFYLSVNNPGKDAIQLDTSNTVFSFDNGQFSTSLDSPLTLIPGVNRLKFRQKAIGGSVSAGNYTPQVKFAGLGAYQGLNGSISAGDGELSVQPIRILSIIVPAPKEVRRGAEKQQIKLKVRNSGNYTVDVDSVHLTFDPNYNFTQQRTAGTDSIPMGTDAVYEFTVTIPKAAPEDSITVDGQIFTTARLTGDKVHDSGADQTDYFIVSQQADLDYVSFSPMTVSENQNTQFIFQIRNNGQYDVILNKDSTRLEFGSQTFYLTDNQTATAGSVSTLTFQSQAISLSAAGSPYAGTIFVYGTENTMPVRDTLYTASAGDSLHVQTIAQLSIQSVALSDTAVSQGAEGDTLTVALQNTGQATAVISSSDSVIIRYNSDYNLTPLQSFPFELSGNTSSDLRYVIKVAADAPLGADTFRVEIGYKDQNSEINYHAADNQKYDTWDVLGKGQIQIYSVLTEYDSVSTGQDSILVTMRIANNGENSVQLDSVGLNISNGNYVAGTIKRSVSKTLAVGQSDTVNFKVEVLSSSTTGSASLNGWAYGHDPNSGALLQDSGADTTDSWNVVSAADIVTGNYEPEFISSGQLIEPWVIVTNQGEAILNLDTAKSYLYIEDNPAFKRYLVRPVQIEGLATDTLFFESDTASGPSGQYTLNLKLVGQENGSYYNQTLDIADKLNIQDMAILNIDSVIAAAENISQGTDTSVVVVIKNDGEAALLVDTLYLTNYPQIQRTEPALTAQIDGGSKQRFTLFFNVPVDDPTGNKTLDAVARGRDKNFADGGVDSTLSDDGANVTDNWTVFTPADVKVNSITSADSVVQQGENSNEVYILLHNAGEATARINNVTLNERIGLYAYHYPPFGFNLAGNADTTITVLVDVKTNSATGRDTLTADVNFTDLFSQTVSNSSGTENLIWQITTGEPLISTISVTAAPEKVSQGQSGINVNVRVKNTGDKEAVINSLSLKFSNNPSSNYTQGTISPQPGSVQPGVEVTYTIPVEVKNTAKTGVDTFWATMDVHEPETGLDYTVEDSTINDSWTVQQRPAVVTDKVEISPAVASTGQTSLKAKVYVVNQSADYRADAQINDVILLMRKDGEPTNDQFTITRQSSPTLPIVLQNGKTLVFDFDVDVKTDAEPGDYDIFARVTGEDVNDGQAFQSNTVNTPGSLQVQKVAQLTVNSVRIVPDTVSERQDHPRLYVKFKNNGQATAEINSAELTFDQPGLDFNPVLISHSTPFNLSGSTQDTLIYSLEIPEINLDTLTVHVDATISGKDANSREDIQGQSATPGTFLVQSAADVEWVSTDPTSWTVDTAAVQFESVVINNGKARVNLDTSLTRLQIRYVNSHAIVHQIKLDSQSVKIISGKPDSTRLVFNKEVLPIAAGEYDLYLHLIGTTNDSVYNADLYAGQLAFGDSIISIKSIQIQTDDHVPQGADSIIVYMKVSNSQDPKTITPDLTKLIFKGPNKSEDRDAFVLNLQRLDTLTVLKSEENNLLKFQFDITDNFPANDATEIYGQIGLDNGDIVKVSNTFDKLYVQTSGNAIYVSETLSPDSVVAQEKISFTLSLVDTGSADITLNSDKTYLQILGTSIDKIYLSADYTISGLDTASVLFNEIQLPADLSPGDYDVNLHISGRTLGDNLVEKDTLIANALKVIEPGHLLFSRIEIPALRVRLGQNDVPVNFTLKNIGESPTFLYDLEYYFKRISDQKDVSENWVQVRGTIEDTVIAAGDSLNFPVYFNIRSQADTGLIVPKPMARFYDQRRSHVEETSDSVIVNDQVRVIRPARLRIDSLKIVSGSLAPNPPHFNFGQIVPLKIVLSNLGEDTIAAATLKLYRNGFALPGEVLFQNIPPAPDSQKVGYYNWQADQLQEQQIKVKIAEVKDLIGEAVSIEQSVDDVERLVIHQPSQLWVEALITEPEGARDSVVSLNQQFTVSASVNHQGNSSFGQGQLVIRLPENYRLADSPADSVLDFGYQNPQAQWQVKPVNVTEGLNFDSIKVFLKTIPLDSNTAQPVIIAEREASVPVKVENKGIVESQLTIASPAGAADSVVSAGQEFVVRTTFNFLGPVSASGKRAQIILPEGFSVKDSSIVNLPDGFSVPPVDWRVVAPLNASSEIFNIFVDALVLDANSGQPITVRSSPLPVRVVTPPEIVMSTRIAAPDGAKDFVVSTGQKVILQTIIGNTGQAEFDSSGVIRMVAEGGIVFTKNRQTNEPLSAVNAIEHFAKGVYQDTLIMPMQPGSGVITIQILDGERPKDANSGQSAKVRRDSLGIPFQIVKRTELAVKFDHGGTVNDTLFRSTNQDFLISARVENRGAAGVKDAVWIKLDTLSSRLILIEGDSLSHKVEVGQITQWKVKTPPSDHDGNIRVVVDSLHPALDENSLMWAFTSDTAAVDTLNLSIKKVDNILISSSFVRNHKDSLIVSTDQFPITVASRLVFHDLLDGDKKVVLTPPKGFASLDTSFNRNIELQVADLEWQIRAPAEAMGWQKIIITATARSQSIPGLNPVVVQDTVFILVVPKAQLALSAKIVEPAGAIDDSVSPGQIFKLQALVTNKPDVAGTKGTGTVVLRTGSYFSIVDKDGNALPEDSTKTFTPDQPVYWWVKVADTPPGKTTVSSLSRKKTLKERIELMESQNFSTRTLSLSSLPNNEMEVEVTALPLDENSEKPAFIQNEKLRKSLFISQKAVVKIVRVPSDTVSTGQNYPFVVAAQISENIINPFVKIQIGSEHLGAAPEPIPLSQNNQAVWNFKVPVNYSGNGVETIQVQLVGTDENSGMQTTDSKETKLIVRQKARLALSNPVIQPIAVANTGLVSQGQEVEISLRPLYAAKQNDLEYAKISGQGTVVLDSAVIKQGFVLMGSETLARVFSDTGQVLSWKVKAPYQNLTANLIFKFDQLPVDVNDSLPVELDKDFSNIAIPVRVRQKTITIKAEPLDISDTTLTKGQTNVPLMSFTISNKEFNDPLHVSGIKVGFYATNESPDPNNLLSPRALFLMFKSIQVMDYDDFKTVAKKSKMAKPAISYVNVQISDSTQNPLWMGFDQTADLEPGEEKKLIVVAQFQDNVVNRVFRANLQQVRVYDFDPEKPLNTADESGQKLEESEQLTSKSFTLVSTDPKEAFGNYPNPFGRQYDYTNIAFLLEQDSDVEIRIFTLTGELVWSKQLSGLRRGFYDRLVKWDGRNDNGQRVLNGVYLGTIDIKPLDGGAAKRYITKIAYIK
ncbi:MAG: hypothetical protein GXO77_00340, partial [Calditrichaeota bacterium]|nr:hypothetical protein [Calditrichota bacterium]